MDTKKNRKIMPWLRALGVLVVSLGAGLGLSFLWMYIEEEIPESEDMADGSHYHGYLNHDMPDGEGVLERPDGTTIEGIWEDGDISYATITGKDYTYEGELEDMRYQGYGVLTKTDGASYRGFWDGGSRDGLGLASKSDGQLEFGYWIDGALDVPAGQDYSAGEVAYGIDVSRHQPTIDWADLCLYADSLGNVKSYGQPTPYLQPVLFVFIKSTEGDITDPDFEKNFEQAKEHGILRGAYHFLGFRSSAEVQAKNYIEHTQLVSGDLPPVLDMEVPERLMKKYTDKLCQMAHQWLDIVEKHYGVKPIIYTYDRYFNDFLKGRGFDDYPIWVARYYADKKPSMDDWMIWQFTDKGNIGGIPRTVDIDRYESTYSHLKEICLH